MDFTTVLDEFVITGMGAVSAPVNITDDTESEDMKNFFANLGFGEGVNFPNIRFKPAVARADIIDQDSKITILVLHLMLLKFHKTVCMLHNS